MSVRDGRSHAAARRAQALLLLFAVSGASGVLAGMPDSDRQRQLEHLLRQDCGSCHGLRLTGGLGSPLTATGLAGRSEDYLFAVIRNGLPGTPMPPWSALLDDDDIRWLARRLLAGEVTP